EIGQVLGDGSAGGEGGQQRGSGEYHGFHEAMYSLHLMPALCPPRRLAGTLAPLPACAQVRLCTGGCRWTMRAVDMAQIPARIDAVAHELFELLYIREAIVALALPDQRAVEMDLEDAAGTGNQRDFTDLEREGRK